mmetsp:Transcript_29228/g.79097  ORF Transcript_29228/g.79097 Transcript_29228/m.79097 type:complete len:82 (-) Transcript_29228:308-553(-)
MECISPALTFIVHEKEDAICPKNSTLVPQHGHSNLSFLHSTILPLVRPPAEINNSKWPKKHEESASVTSPPQLSSKLTLST